MSTRQITQIAIDGPGGSGKSTVAKLVSQQLGFTYVDTGAIYRAIAFYCLRHEIEPTDRVAVTAALKEIQITITYIENTQQVFLNGENVSNHIRSLPVSQATSMVSSYPEVRDKLLDLQRNMAKNQSVVMDGRDIGTVVLPHAQVKVFLTASVETRAARRLAELQAQAVEVQADLAQVIKEIEERDHRDSTREVAPLIPAEDAVFIDTTDLNIKEVTQKIINLVEGQVR